MRKGIMGLLGWIFIAIIILVALGYLAIVPGNPRIELQKFIFPDTAQAGFDDRNNTVENIRR